MNIAAFFRPDVSSARYIAGCALALLVLTSAIFAERLPIKTYTVAEGLLRDYVYRIRQDSRGFIWFCTPGGLSRFDGYAFTNFTDHDGLPERHVNDLVEMRDGTIWIATDAGAARLDPRGVRGSADHPIFVTYRPDDATSSREILHLLEGPDGQLFAGTMNGLFRIIETGGSFRFERIDLGPTTTSQFEVTAVITDRDGSIWIGTYLDGLYRLYPDGHYDRFTTANGLAGDRVESLLQDNNGRIWVGLRAGYKAGLCLLKADPGGAGNVVERVFTTRDGLPADWIMDLRQTSDGNMWVATTRGLCRWQGSYGEVAGPVCKTYTAKNDVCDTNIWSLTEDREGNLWMGTRCGAKKLSRYGFTTYTDADGIDTAFINSIFEDAAGDLYASFDRGESRTLSRFDGERFEHVKPTFPSDIGYFGWGTRQTVLKDRRGDWWFPTGMGLYRFPRTERIAALGGSIPQRVSPPGKNVEIFRVLEDSRGVFWIATTGEEQGMWLYDPTTGVWQDLSEELGFAGTDRLGLAIAEDRSGNIWIATGGTTSPSSLIRYRQGEFRIFSQDSGWPQTSTSDLFVDHADRLWMATGEGALRLDDLNADHLQLVRYSIAEGLSTPGAACINEDTFDRIYICTARGLDRLDPVTGRIENFTTDNGLPNSFPQMAHRDRYGRLWFGTTDGLARFDPEPKKQRLPPNALITGLRVNGVARSVSILGESTIDVPELAADEQQLSIDFLGLGTDLGENLKYEYRTGDTDWVPAVERTVNFANLGSGGYRFEVRALSADGLYSSTASVGFSVATPLWRRWWFAAGVLLLTAFVIYTFYRYRLQRLLELERMRTRIATDLHDDIGSNLTRIAVLSEVAKQQATNGASALTRELLPSIADIARESVASMNDIVWAISPDHDSLLDLTRRMRQHADEVFTLRDVDLEFNAPATDNELRLGVDIRRDLLLIFKEAVNNAAKHSGCTRVRIDLGCRDSILSLKIRDNGTGFTTLDDNDGHGLRSMARRAEAHRAVLNIESPPGEGTLVEFELRLLRHG